MRLVDEISCNIAMSYQKASITQEKLKSLEGQITRESFWYLLGKVCHDEKNNRGDRLVKTLYIELGSYFGYAHHSLARLVTYTYAIDKMHKTLPDIAKDILSGKVRISIQDTVNLAKMGLLQICSVVERIQSDVTPTTIIINEQKAQHKKSKRRGRPKLNKSVPPRISVKDTPPHDPDAQVNALALTIPSWMSTIDRVFNHTDFSEVSSTSRRRLIEELKKVRDAADIVAALIMEEK